MVRVLRFFVVVGLVLGAPFIGSAPPAAAADLITVSGKVTLADGTTGLSGASVWWAFDGNLATKVAVDTGADGSYTFANISAGPALLFIQYRGGVAAPGEAKTPAYFRWSATYSPAASTTINVAFPATHDLALTVVDDVTGSPVPGATVVATDQPRCRTSYSSVAGLDSCFWEPYHGVADDNGKVTIPVIDEAGTETLALIGKQSTFGEGTVSGMTSVDTAREIRLSAPAIYGVVTATDAAGNAVPVANALVSFAAPGATRTVLTSADGSYSLRVTQALGELSVTARYNPVSTYGAVATDPPMPNVWSLVKVTPSSGSHEVNLHLPKYRQIPVTVVDTSNEPVEGAVISSKWTNVVPGIIPNCSPSLVDGIEGRCDWGVYEMPVTGIDGTTTITVVDDADTPDYELIATDGANSARSGSVLGGNDPVTIVLPAVHTVSGKVALSDGTPVPEARVSFHDPTTGAPQSTVFTAADGTYQLALSPGPGTLVIEAAHDGKWGDRAPVNTPYAMPANLYLSRPWTQDTQDHVVNLTLPAVIDANIRVTNSQTPATAVPGALADAYTKSTCGNLPEGNDPWSLCQWFVTSPNVSANGQGEFSVRVFSGWPVHITVSDAANVGRRGAFDGSISDAVVRTIALPDPPAPPASVAATSADGSVADVLWSTPPSDGGSSITQYEVVADPVLSAVTTRTKTFMATTVVPTTVTKTITDPAVRSTTLTGLVPGTTYVVSVRAKNAIGWGSPTSAAVVAPTPPGPPTNLTAGPAGKGALGLAWGASASNGSAVLRYEYRIRTGRGGFPVTWSNAGNVLALTVAKLKPKTLYFVEVRAVNGLGAGPAASASGTTGR